MVQDVNLGIMFCTLIVDGSCEIFKGNCVSIASVNRKLKMKKMKLKPEIIEKRSSIVGPQAGIDH